FFTALPVGLCRNDRAPAQRGSSCGRFFLCGSDPRAQWGRALILASLGRIRADAAARQSASLTAAASIDRERALPAARSCRPRRHRAVAGAAVRRWPECDLFDTQSERDHLRAHGPVPDGNKRASGLLRLPRAFHLLLSTILS